MRDIFDNDCVVIPVNTSLIMGKGLAKECADRYPEMGQLRDHLFWTLDFEPGTAKVACWKDKVFVLAATKKHWSNPSQLEWIERLCADSIPNEIMATAKEGHEIRTIGIPALGCGNGKLKREDVQPMLENLQLRLCQMGFIVTIYP
jgi:hypothetical protein